MALILFITRLLELMAAFSASYYWLKTKDQSVRPFVWYLWVIVFVETLGMYTLLYEHFDNSFINWIENSVFVRNIWLYNIYFFVSLILIGMYMIRNTKNDMSHKIIKVIVVVSSLFTVCYFSITGGFFTMALAYDLAVQTFAIFIMVLLYLQELIKSEQILDFYKSHVFYISLALSLWYICLTPLFIFDSYYRAVNSGFVAFRIDFLNISNILLYSCYIFAFLYSLWHKRKLVLR
jgi:hypothetical protein